MPNETGVGRRRRVGRHRGLSLNTSSGPRGAERLFGERETLHAPHLLDVEVTQVMRRYARTGPDGYGTWFAGPPGSRRFPGDAIYAPAVPRKNLAIAEQRHRPRCRVYCAGRGVGCAASHSRCEARVVQGPRHADRTDLTAGDRESKQMTIDRTTPR